MNRKITMAHGSGGRDSALLMSEIFGRYFANPVLDRLEDAASLPFSDLIGSNTTDFPAPDICSVNTLAGHSPDASVAHALGVVSPNASNQPRPDASTSLSGTYGSDRSNYADSIDVGDLSLVVSTDSFVVTPLEFKGGDIGKLAVCGTINDLLMMGAEPRYLTSGFILEEGLPIEQLDRIAASMAKTARSCGVTIIAGDTKVVEGSGGLYLNTTGIGLRSGPAGRIGAGAARSGDAVLLSGNLGDHHACILSARMGIENNIKSDCDLLTDIVAVLIKSGIGVRVMRDVTRGGLGTVLNEIAAASGVSIEVEESNIPVHPEVRGFCGIMGLDPLYMGNEGKMIAIVREADAEQALKLMRATEIGQNACRIGHVAAENTSSSAPSSPASVVMRTRIGGHRRIDMLYGEGLPRIC